MEKKDANYKYSCLMYKFPSAFAKKVIDWGKEKIKDDDIHVGDDDDMGREDEIHVTIKYGIHTSNAEDIHNIVDDIDPFYIKLGKIGKFEGDGYDVLFISVDGKELKELNKKVSSELECTDSHPVYKPHVTIAYVKPGSCDDLVGDDKFNNEELTVGRYWWSTAEGEKRYLSPRND